MRRTHGDIHFDLTRSDRKTASIYVERDGSVSVHVPRALTEEKLGRMMEAKRVWIYKSLAEWRDLNAARVAREYVNGEGFEYLGRSYRLKLEARQQEPLLLKDGFFCLRSALVGDDGSSAQEAFRAFYREKGLLRLPERVAYYQPKLGVNAKAVRVMELQHRWASCSTTGVNFHWKVMMMPPRIIDYIVVHELAHLLHPNHTQRFWNEVDKVMPDYDERKSWLRSRGARMSL